MSHLTAFETSDLKLIYRTLHSQIRENDELLDSAFFHELQLWLQTIARSEGVDTTIHAQWDAWLGKVPSLGR